MEYWSLLCYLSAFIDGVKSHTEYFLQMYPLFCRCLSMLISPLKPWVCLTRICMVVYLYKHVCLYVRIHTTKCYIDWMCTSVRIKSGRYSLSDSSFFSFPSKWEQICIHLFCSSYKFAYINCRVKPNLPNQVIFYCSETQMRIGVEKFSPRSNSQKLTKWHKSFLFICIWVSFSDQEYFKSSS